MCSVGWLSFVICISLMTDGIEHLYFLTIYWHCQPIKTCIFLPVIWDCFQASITHVHISSPWKWSISNFSQCRLFFTCTIFMLLSEIFLALNSIFSSSWWFDVHIHCEPLCICFYCLIALARSSMAMLKGLVRGDNLAF